MNPAVNDDTPDQNTVISGYNMQFCLQGMIGAGIVIILEIYPRHQHALVGVGLWLIWALGYVALVPYVYFIRNWRYLQVAITLPMVFFSVAYIW